MKTSSTKRDDLQQLAADLAKVCAGTIRAQMSHLRLGQISQVNPRADVPITIRRTGNKQLTLLAPTGGFTGMVRRQTVARLQGFRVKVVTRWPREELTRFAIS